MINNYYSAKIEFISLQFSQQSQDNYYCAISLTKGIHQFGKVQFFIDNGQIAYYFQEPKIIPFYFPPKMVQRKDVFFKLNFQDVETGDHFGTIQISTNNLSDTFAEDKNAVIVEKKQFFQGATLQYKIYMPKIQIYRGTKLTLSNNEIQKSKQSNLQINDIISSLFSRPDLKQKPKRKIKQVKKQQSIEQIRLQNKANILSMFDFLKRKKIEQKYTGQKQSKDSIIENSDGAQIANNLLFSTMSFIKQESAIKHTLTPTYEQDHHSSKSISLKLKTVIFLLIFGFLALAFDSFQDRSELKAVKPQIQTIMHHQQKVKNKKKKKKNQL